MKLKSIIASLFVLFVAITTQAQIDRTKQPQPAPAPVINLGKPRIFELKNGLKVMVVEDNKLPRVRASLLIDNKPHLEKGKEGLSELFAQMMGTGTTSISKDKFNEEIDFMGAYVHYGDESAFVSSTAKFFPEALALMADGLIHPIFSEEEFVKQRDIILEGLRSIQNSAPSISENVSGAFLYGKNHPYGVLPTEESVNNINLNDIQTYYDNYIVPKNAYLVIVGDIKYRKAKRLVKKLFNDWKSKEVIEQDLPKVPEVKETSVYFVDVPNAVQSKIIVQRTIDLKKSDPDYFPLLVANQVLGGDFGSYLNMNLREANGYTYGVRSNTSPDKYIGKFITATSVRNAVTDSAVVEIFKEINHIKDSLVSEENIKKAKNKFAGSFVLNLEKPSTIADYALNIETDDLPQDFYKNFLKNINAVTAEDIQRVANKYYDSDKMQIVVVGRGSEVSEGLEKMNINGKPISVSYYNKEAEAIKKPVYTKPIPEGITLRYVYDAYIKAIGGKKAANKIKNVTYFGSGMIGGMSISYKEKRTIDGKMLLEVGINGMSIFKNVFNGENGYTLTQGRGKMPYEEWMKETAKKTGGLFPELKENTTATLLGIENVDGKDAYVVKASEKSKDYYDVETGLKIKSVEFAKNSEVGTIFKDYKPVNGVKFPHEVVVDMGQLVPFIIKEVKVNEKIDSKEFE